MDGYQIPTVLESNLPLYTGHVPSLTIEEMVEVDRAMVEDYQITLVQMMENAGRNLAHLARIRFLGQDPPGKKVVVLAGTGGNGGGALVAARRLATYGARLSVVTTRPADDYRGMPAQQLEILTRMNIPIYQHTALQTMSERVDLIIDGIIGYNLTGTPRDSAAELIRWANEYAAPILALDIPSGVHGTSGTVYDPAIRATATMTLALPKTGLMQADTAPNVGELYLSDISVPRALYGARGLNLNAEPLFADSDIIRLR
jgi:NAD(P)H-hydrate epimerase